MTSITRSLAAPSASVKSPPAKSFHCNAVAAIDARLASRLRPSNVRVIAATGRISMYT